MEQRLKTKGENWVLIIRKKGRKEIDRNSNQSEFASMTIIKINMGNYDQKLDLIF